jgi:AmiR/NasT family two-component response regulator
MNEFLKTDISGYIKDPLSQAVINTNDAEYNRVLMERSKAKEIVRLTQDVDNMKSELTEIKNLLMQIANGRQNG